MMTEHMSNMCMELISIPGLSIQIKSQVFNYFVIHVIIPQYHLFCMAKEKVFLVFLRKAVMGTSPTAHSPSSPPPPQIAVYIKCQFITDYFFIFKIVIPLLAKKLINFPILHLFGYVILGFINFQMCGLGVFIKSPQFVFEAIKNKLGHTDLRPPTFTLRLQSSSVKSDIEPR